MKKIFFVLSALALVIGMGSCQKDEPKLTDNTLVVTASLNNGAATKVTYTEVSSPQTGLKGTWVKTTDKLYGLWKESGSSNWNQITFTCSDVKDGMGYFTVSSGTAPSDGATVNVVYAGSRTVNISQNKATLSFDPQEGKLESIGKYIVLWATATVSNGKLHFDFQPAVSVLKMNLKTTNNPKSGKVYVVLKHITNSITVNFEATTFDEAFTIVPVTTSDVKTKIYLTADTNNNISTTPKEFYAVIPAAPGGTNHSVLELNVCKSYDGSSVGTDYGRSQDGTAFYAGKFIIIGANDPMVLQYSGN